MQTLFAFNLKNNRRSFYCPKEFTVIKDNGKLYNMHIHSYTVIDDKGFESTVDDETYQSVTLKI